MIGTLYNYLFIILTVSAAIDVAICTIFQANIRVTRGTMGPGAPSAGPTSPDTRSDWMDLPSTVRRSPLHIPLHQTAVFELLVAGTSLRDLDAERY